MGKIQPMDIHRPRVMPAGGSEQPRANLEGGDGGSPHGLHAASLVYPPGERVRSKSQPLAAVFLLPQSRVLGHRKLAQLFFVTLHQTRGDA